MTRLLDRLSPRPGRRELIIVGLVIAAGIALRLAYVIATKGHALAGDEIQYDAEGRLAAAGHFLWGTAPFGIAHATTWKSPGYAAWVGALYKLIGAHPDRVFVVQAVVLTPFTVGLSWLLGRRLFGVWAGVAAAVLMAFYPNAWQFDVRLYSEALANPLTILALLLILGVSKVSFKRAACVGVVIGVLMLIRPSSVLLLAGVAVAWWAASGLRRGTAQLAVTVGIVVLILVPWSVRNASLNGPWVPISVQTAAGYGVFNDDAAHDSKQPWSWRPMDRRDRDLLSPKSSHLTDGAFYRTLNKRMFRYIEDHPSSVPKAFFWNGITRLWDVRHPSQALAEVKFEGRTRAVTAVGLAMYWPLLLLALVGLAGEWRRGRRGLVLTVLAIALAASVVYTTDGGTRYRAPLEGMIVVLASGAVAPWLSRRLARPPRAEVEEAAPVAVTV